jgi:hypothetical protein
VQERVGPPRLAVHITAKQEFIQFSPPLDSLYFLKLLLTVKIFFNISWLEKSTLINFNNKGRFELIHLTIDGTPLGHCGRGGCHHCDSIGYVTDGYESHVFGATTIAASYTTSVWTIREAGVDRHSRWLLARVYSACRELPAHKMGKQKEPLE